MVEYRDYVSQVSQPASQQMDWLVDESQLRIFITTKKEGKGKEYDSFKL